MLQELTQEMMELNESAIRIERNSLAASLDLKRINLNVSAIGDILLDMFDSAMKPKDTTKERLLIDGRSFRGINNRLDKINEGLNGLLKAAVSLTSIQKEALAQAIEEFDFNKDKAREEKVDKARKQPNVDKPEKQEREKLEGIGFAEASITAAIGALVGGLVGVFGRQTKLLIKGIRGAFSISRKLLFKLLPRPVKMFAFSFAMALEDLGKEVKTIASAAGKTFKSGVSKLFSPITNTLNKFTSGYVDDVIKSFGSISKTVGGLFSKFGNIASGIGDLSVFKKFFGIFRVLGRVFTPLFTAFEVFKGVKGEIDKLGEDVGILEIGMAVLKGGAKGLVSGLFTGLLDLIKDGVSWITEKLGFTEFSAMLDSFSFVDLGNKLIDGIGNFFTNVKNYFTNGEFINDMKALGKTLIDGAMAVIDGYIDLVTQPFKDLYEIFSSDDPIGTAIDIVKRKFQAVADVVTGIFNWVKEKFSWVPSLGESLKAVPTTAEERADNRGKTPDTQPPLMPQRSAAATRKEIQTRRIAELEAEKERINNEIIMQQTTKAETSISTVNNGMVVASQSHPDPYILGT